MSGADEAAPGPRVTITLTLDEAAAVALATVIRRVTPHDFADTLAGVDVQAWYRALDALSPQLPDDLRTTAPASPATYPGEPGSLADIGRQRFEREEREYRAARGRW